MLKKILATVTCLMALVNFMLVQPARSQSLNKKAIICLTYDDALSSQLNNVIPQLDSIGFKGTFFLNSIAGSSEIIGQGSESLRAWKKASKNSHELANHTLFHPCPEKLGWQKDIAIDSYTTKQLFDEIIACHNYLNQIEGKRDKRSFAYTCNNNIVEGKSFSSNLRTTNVISWARTGGDNNSIIVDFNHLDKFMVPSWHVMENTTGVDLIAFAKQAIDKKALGIYQFHDIGGSLFSVSVEAHKQLLTFLKENEDKVTIMTFRDAMNVVESKK